MITYKTWGTDIDEASHEQMADACKLPVAVAQTDLVETVARFDPIAVKMCGDGSPAED